jgi:hypothetical protein
VEPRRVSIDSCGVDMLWLAAIGIFDGGRPLREEGVDVKGFCDVIRLGLAMSEKRNEDAASP